MEAVADRPVPRHRRRLALGGLGAGMGLPKPIDGFRQVGDLLGQAPGIGLLRRKQASDRL